MHNLVFFWNNLIFTITTGKHVFLINVVHRLNCLDIIVTIVIFTFVKLHSDLRILTQLQLVGVGVDFVFPLEGRKEEEEGRNPHLASSRRIDPTCLNFGDCLVGVWRVYGNCLEGVWQVSGGCLVGVWRVS